jgi:hypothetical protein
VNRHFSPVGSIFLDQIMIIVFILIGMLFHGTLTAESAVTWQGLFLLFGQAFPFMLAGFLTWAGLIVKQYGKLMKAGLVVWAGTTVLGLLFRFMNNQGVEPMFIVTTPIFLGVLLMGWRLIAYLIVRNRPEPETAWSSSEAAAR